MQQLRSAAKIDIYDDRFKDLFPQLPAPPPSAGPSAAAAPPPASAAPASAAPAPAATK
jgi:hypothetical protein